MNIVTFVSFLFIIIHSG